MKLVGYNTKTLVFTALININALAAALKNISTFEIYIICKLLYYFDNSEYFGLIIRKNTRFCTHGNYTTLLLMSNV